LTNSSIGCIITDVTIKTKSILYVCSTLVLIMALMPQTVSARTNVRLRQRIRPIPCGVDHLTDPDGVEHYFVPRVCGKLIVPTSNSSSGSSSSTGSGGINGATPLYLETKSHAIGENAYLVLAKKGQVYTFRLLGDSELSPFRTIEIVRIANNTVTLMFTPGDKEITLPIGGKVDADIAFGGDPDINIRIKSISPDGLVAMQIWFPMQREFAGIVDDTMHSEAALAITGTLITAAGILHFHSRRRIRQTQLRITK